MTTTLTLSPAVPGSATATTFLAAQNTVIQTARLDAVLDLTRVKGWINTIYQDVANETRCLRASGTATLTSNVSEYLLDPKILHIELITVTPVGGTQGFPLKEAQLIEIQNCRATGSGAASPSRKYCLEPMNTLELWPTPSTGDTITFWYSYLPSALSADGDTTLLPEPHAANLLQYGALVQAAEFKRDIMMLGDYQSQYATAMQDFQKYLNRKAGAYPGAFPTWTGQRPFAPHDPSADIPWDWSV